MIALVFNFTGRHTTCYLLGKCKVNILLYWLLYLPEHFSKYRQFNSICLALSSLTYIRSMFSHHNCMCFMHIGHEAVGRDVKLAIRTTLRSLSRLSSKWFACLAVAHSTSHEGTICFCKIITKLLVQLF